MGTELAMSTSYHPQSDKQTEIVNKWIEGILEKLRIRSAEDMDQMVTLG